LRLNFKTNEDHCITFSAWKQFAICEKFQKRHKATAQHYYDNKSIHYYYSNIV